MPSNTFLFCVCFYLDELHLLIHRPVHIYPTGCVLPWISSWISISGVYKALPLQTFVPSGTHTPVLRARTKVPDPAGSGADTQRPPLQAPCGLRAGAAAHGVCSELTLAQELPPQTNLRGWTAPAPGEAVTGPGLSLHLLRAVPERRTRPRQVWEGTAPLPARPTHPSPAAAAQGGPWRGQTGGGSGRAGARGDRGPARSPRGEAALPAPPPQGPAPRPRPPGPPPLGPGAGAAAAARGAAGAGWSRRPRRGRSSCSTATSSAPRCGAPPGRAAGPGPGAA